MSVESALTLMISFGTFTVALIVAVVQIVNNQNNKK
ncbi:putative holin-like toxin [Candidatus Enterococcus leclercqii]|nr:putative holin-like toxin [Enterococcus sp. CU9D]KAF1294230.1 holin [Enterococcus sp. CU9D]